MGSTTDELCSRWTTLGAFMPFARNHNGIGERDQEPYTFPEAEMAHMKTAIKMRYSFISYLYTQMHIVHREGGTVFRPQFYNFPADDSAVANPEENIMIGDAIKLAMQYKQGINTQSYYFPAGSWANIVDGSILTGGTEISLDTPWNKINLFLRASRIAPWTMGDPLTTVDVQAAHTSLIVLFAEA
jgi:alpha-glucosidase (family GH31 glycosyl hydrolase)